MPHLLLGLALAIAAPAPKDPPKKEAPSLVGVWSGESGTRGGKPDHPPAGTTIEFTADGKVLIKEGTDREPEGGTYRAVRTKTPAEIDITPPGKGNDPMILGIFKIEGDTLTMCFALGGDRPKDFVSPAGSEAMLITCKRVKTK